MTRPFLERFKEAQDCFDTYQTALQEIRDGEKRTHWIWYIFPQMKGLGFSENSNYYGITSLLEARAYLDDACLGPRLREISTAVYNQSGRDIEDIMGSRIDAMKLLSSMTLFDMVDPGCVFGRILEEFFDGKKDDKTIQMTSREYEMLKDDSALRRFGALGRINSERTFFEDGVVESEEADPESKLATLVDLALEGNSIQDMVSWYLYHKDFTPYRLSGVDACLSGRITKLLFDAAAQVKDPDARKILARHIQRDDSNDDVYDTAEEFDRILEDFKANDFLRKYLDEMCEHSLTEKK